MTDSRNVAKYESLINGRHPIESKLAENIIEYLNVEFSLGTVKDLNTARTWLKSTFFYIRASSNPMQYFPGSSILDVDTSIDDLLVNAVGKLREAGMIHKVDKDELYSSSLYGKAMSKYYIRFGTMCQFLDLLESYRSKDLAIDSCSVTRAIITCFGNADEFMELRYQPGEKKFLNDLVAPKSLNAAKIKYPFLTPTQGKLKETWQKVYLLVQVHLGDIAVSDRQQSATWNAMLMNQEINFIVTQGNRILRCFLDCFSKMAEEPSGLSTGLVFLFEALVRFSCALFGGSWSDSHHVLRQVDKLGKAYTNALTDAGVTTFKELSHLDPRKLEFILGRNPPFGNTVLSALAKFPLFYIRVNQMVLRDENSALKREMYVTVGLFNPEQVSLKNQSGSLTAHLFICAVQGKSCRLLLYGRPSMSELKFNKDIKLTLPSDPDANFDIIVSVIPDYVSGLEVQERFECEVIQKDSHQVDIIAEKLTEPIPRDSVNRIQITGDSIEHIEHVNFNAPIHNAIKKKKTKCKHRCFNRLLCRHNCCKEAPNQHQITDGNSNFLAKAPEKITEFPNIIDNLNLKQDITEQIFEDSFDMPSLHENVTLESSTGYVLASDDSSLIQRQKSVSSNFSSPATHKRIRPNILTPLLERAYRFDSPLSNTPETPINCNRSGLSTNINMNHHSTLPMNINTKHCCNLSANNHSRLPICSKHPDSFSSFPSPEGSFQSVPAGDINHFSSVSDKQYTKSQSFSSGTRKSSDFRSYLEQFKARYNNSSNLRGEVHVETLSQKKSIAAFNAEAIVGNKVLLSKWTT